MKFTLIRLAASATTKNLGRESQNHIPQGLSGKSLRHHFALWPLFGSLGFAVILATGTNHSCQLRDRFSSRQCVIFVLFVLFMIHWNIVRIYLLILPISSFLYKERALSKGKTTDLYMCGGDELTKQKIPLFLLFVVSPSSL